MSEKGTMSKAEQNNLFTAFAGYAYLSYKQNKTSEDENRKRVAALYLWLSSDKFRKPEDRVLVEDFKRRHELTEFNDGKIPPLDGALVKKLGDIIKNNPEDPAFLAADDALSEIAKDNKMSEKEYVTVSNGMFVDKNRSLATIYKNPALTPLLAKYTASIQEKAKILCAHYIQTSDQSVLLVPPGTEKTPQEIAQLEKELQDDLYKILYLLDWYDKKDEVIPRDFEEYLKTEEGQRGLNDFKEKNPQFSDYNGFFNREQIDAQTVTTPTSQTLPDLDPDTTSLIGENGPLTIRGPHHVKQTVIPSYQLLDILSLGKLSDGVFKITGASKLIELSRLPKLAGKLTTATIGLSAKAALKTKALRTLLTTVLKNGLKRQATIAATTTTVALTTGAPTGGATVPAVVTVGNIVSYAAVAYDVYDLSTDIYHEVTTTSDKLKELKLSLPQVWTRNPPRLQTIPDEVLEEASRTANHHESTVYKSTRYRRPTLFDPEANEDKRQWAVDEDYVKLLLQKKFITENFPDRPFNNSLLSPSLQRLSGEEIDKFLEKYAPGALKIYKDTLEKAEPKDLDTTSKIFGDKIITSLTHDPNRGYHQLPLFSTQQSETKANETIAKYLRHLDAINNGQDIEKTDYPDLKTPEQVREAMKKDLADQTLQILTAQKEEERKANIERLQHEADNAKIRGYPLDDDTKKRLETLKQEDEEINKISAEIERLKQEVKTAKGSDLADAEKRLEDAEKRRAELNRISIPQNLIGDLTSDVLTAYDDQRKSMRQEKLDENFETTLSNISDNISAFKPEVLKPSGTNFAGHEIYLTDENDPNYIPPPWLTDFSDYTDEALLTTYATKNLDPGQKDAIRFELFLRNPHYVSYSPDTSFTAEDIQLLRIIQANPTLLPGDFDEKITHGGAGERIPLGQRYKINGSLGFARGIKSEQIDEAMGRILSAYQKTMNTEPPPQKLETISTLIDRYSATHGESLKPLKGVFDQLATTVPESAFFGLADWISANEKGVKGDWDTCIKDAQQSIENASKTPLAFPAEIVGRYIEMHRGGQPVNPLQMYQYYAEHPLRPTVEVEIPNASSELFVEVKDAYKPPKLPEGAQYFSYVPQRRGQKISIPSYDEITGLSVTEGKEPEQQPTMPDLFWDIMQFQHPEVTFEAAMAGWEKLPDELKKFMLEQNKKYIEALESQPGTTKGKILESFLESQYVPPTAPKQQPALESQYVQPTAPEQPVSTVKKTLRKNQVPEGEPETTARAKPPVQKPNPPAKVPVQKNNPQARGKE